MPRAIVIGAGVGGLTAAIALRRVGIDAVVFERANDLKKIQIGGGLQIWTNAMKALAQLDLMQPLLAASAELGRCEFRTASGDVMVGWSVADESRALGAPSVGVSRVDLHRVLLDALPPDAVELGTELKHFRQDRDGVTARFANGREENGDMLIGADGAQSVVRNQLFGPTPVKYAGYSVFQTIANLNGASPPDDLFGMWYGRGKRFIYYRVARGTQHWAAIVNATPSGKKPQLVDLYRDWQDPIPAMIAATDESAISRVDIYGRDPLPAWGVGRVTLLGDAAHPITLNLGRGACQAIEDAVVLAKKLHSARDVVAGLRAYEDARQERTAWIMKRAWLFGILGQLNNPALCWMRNTAFRMTRERVVRDTTLTSAYEV